MQLISRKIKSVCKVVFLGSLTSCLLACVVSPPETPNPKNGLCTKDAAFELGQHDAKKGYFRKNNVGAQCPQTNMINHYYQQGYIATKQRKNITHPHMFSQFMHNMHENIHKIALKNKARNKARNKKGKLDDEDRHKLAAHITHHKKG